VEYSALDDAANRTARDLAGTKRVEAALLESKLRLKTIFDSVLAGVVIIDAQTRRIVDANPAALQLIGRPAEAVLGEVCHCFVCPAERNRCPVMDLGQKVDNSERVILSVSGDRIPILKSVVPVLLEERQFLVENFVDIRQQKAVEQELTKRVADLDLARQAADHQTKELAAMRDQALEANRLKSAFLANMSHEIRTPMHAVLCLSELLSGSELTPEQREYAEAILQSGRGLMTLLNDILDFSKIEAGKLDLQRSAFNLQEEMDRVWSILNAPAKAKNVDWQCEICRGTPVHVFGDPDRLRQVLLNLAGNAIKFTDCGYVRVSVEPVSQNGGTTTLRFSVKDTGAGVAAEQQARLFQPFVQGDGSSRRKHGGTGLGLAIARQLVDLMGGSIGMESDPGRGSTFWFTAPFEQAKAKDLSGARAPAQSSPAPQPRETDRLAPGRILVVEDNAINRTIAIRMLEKLGYAADAVCSGHHALKAIEHGNYMLVLMDVQMPEMDGFEATTEIRRRECATHIPIVAMTANAMPGDRDKCIAAGMDDYLSKPVQSSAMKAMIEKWMPARPITKAAFRN
jgi:PAS domain S-box-containing protein